MVSNGVVSNAVAPDAVVSDVLVADVLVRAVVISKRRISNAVRPRPHSHSMVPGGLLVMS